MVKLLVDNGATIYCGDEGLFACIAAERNNLELLKELARFGGNVTQPRSNGTTALHIAVCEGNLEMVEFLLDLGADIDKPDANSWTPRQLADQQAHEEIKSLFSSKTESIFQPQPPVLENQQSKVRFLGKYKSEPVMTHSSQEASTGVSTRTGRACPRRRTNTFHNSIFGIVSAARTTEPELRLPVPDTATCIKDAVSPAPRITVCCPEKEDANDKLVLLPTSFEQLLEIGFKIYGFLPNKVLTVDGAEVDEIEVIRDGDRLMFSSQ